MPIIPRFASVQDPNTPPNVDFSQGIMQAALAGAQLRRMGVEEKQGEAALGMQREGMDMRKQEFGLRKQEFQRGMDAEQDMARAGEFMLNLQSQPRGPQGQPLAPGFAGPQADPMRDEVIAATEFAKTLKTDAAKSAFIGQFRQYQQGSLIQQNTQRVAGNIQDRLMFYAQNPDAGPMVGKWEELALKLDNLDNHPPEKQAAILDALSTEYGQLLDTTDRFVQDTRDRREAQTQIEGLAQQYSFNTEIGKAIRDYGRAAENGTVKPGEALMKAVATAHGFVPDPAGGKGMVTREHAERVKLRQFEDTLDAATDAASKGVPIEVIREARQMAETESRSYSDRGEPPPPYSDLFAESVATLQRLQGGPASKLPTEALGSLPDKASGSAQEASGPQPEPTVKERPVPQPAPSQSFLSVKDPKDTPSRLGRAAGRVGKAAGDLASDLAGAISARSEVQILNVLASSFGSKAKGAASAAAGPLSRIAKGLRAVTNPAETAAIMAVRLHNASVETLNAIADELESAGK